MGGIPSRTRFSFGATASFAVLCGARRSRPGRRLASSLLPEPLDPTIPANRKLRMRARSSEPRPDMTPPDEQGAEDVTIALEPQINPLPSWDLSLLYGGIDDPRLTADMEAQITRAHRFAETYRGRINSLEPTP